MANVVVRHPRVVIALWVLLVAGCTPFSTQLDDRVDNGGYEVPGSDSARARDVARTQLALGSSDIFVALESGDRRALPTASRRLAAALREQPDVARVEPALVARTGQAAILPVHLRFDLGGAQRRLPALRAFVAARTPAGVRATLLGQPAVLERYSDIARDDLARAERVSLPITLAILLIAFMSVIAAGAPMTLASMSLGVTFGALYAMTHVMDLSVFVTNTALTLGLGLAIDFSLFIVTRFREYLADPDATPAEAIVATLTTTGRAVVMSGLTVALSLVGLCVVGVGLFTSMALGAMLAAVIAAAAAVTLVPACLVLFGRRIDSYSVPVAMRAASRARLWRFLGPAILRHRWAIATGTLAVLIVCAIPLAWLQTQVRTLGELPASDSVREQSERVSASFGAGALSPVTIVTRADPRAVAERLDAMSAVAASSAPLRGRNGWSELRVIVTDRPDSPRAERKVTAVRRALAGLPRDTFVGGATAEAMDLKQRIDTRTPLVVVVTLLIAFALLVVGLRSLVVPLKAVLTTLLSVGATLGILTLVFQDLGDHGNLSYFVPIFVFTITVGLSVDYEVFLISRVREEYRSRGDNDEAIRIGLLRSGRPITLAGIVLITVFASFAASSLASFQELGTGMALAVLLDVTLVRSLLVPATLAILGDRNWWFPRLRPRRA
jgi:RND superfamily putative drug exporter